MHKKRRLVIVALGMLATLTTVGSAEAQGRAGRGAAVQVAPGELYNTAKQKLLDGQQIFSWTQSRFDIDGYCERKPHYDFTWFEMQHSTLSFREVEQMIAACPGPGAIPMIRLPDAQEFHIQQSLDIGALGVIIPTVDDVERAREAAKWVRFPPDGRRSNGGGQAGRIWGNNYRQTFNDNVLLVVMIESPTGVANAHEIARVPGVDVVIIGNADLSSFSGYGQSDPEYQEMVTRIHDATLGAGKIWGQANARYARDHPLSADAFFFQNGPSNDGWAPPGRGGGPANVFAPPEGEE